MLRAHLFELFADCSFGSGGVGVQCVALYMNHIPWSLSHTTPAPYSKVYMPAEHFILSRTQFAKLLTYDEYHHDLHYIDCGVYRTPANWDETQYYLLFNICGAERLVLIVANTTDSFEVEIWLSYYILDRQEAIKYYFERIILMLCVALVPL